MSNRSPRSCALMHECAWFAHQPDLALKVGPVEASILQFVHGWLESNNHSVGKTYKGKKWIYNSYKAWAAALKIYSETTVYRAIRNLEKLGFLLSEMLHSFKGNRTKWYTINYDKLNAFLSSFKPQKSSKRGPRNLTRWSRQNDEMLLTQITSVNTGLNGASARETLQPVVEEAKQPVEVEIASVVLEALPEAKVVRPSGEQPVKPQTAVRIGDVLPKVELTVEPEPITEPPSAAPIVDENPISVGEFVDKSLEIVQEIIGSKLEQPLEIDMPLFMKTIKKRMGTHFGLGSLGLDRFRDYCTTFASIPFLMGKKAMSNGNRFVVSIGSVLSAKMIERFWDKSKFFEVYPPKKPLPLTPEEEEMARRKELVPLTPLILPEVLTKAENPLDKRVKEVLYQTLGDVTYQSWFDKTGFVAIGTKNGEPEFIINTGFARQYIWTHYGDQLRKAFEGI